VRPQVLVSASTGLPVAESLASHVEHLLTTTVQDCILYDSEGKEVPSGNLVEACLLPRASAASLTQVRRRACQNAGSQHLSVSESNVCFLISYKSNLKQPQPIVP